MSQNIKVIKNTKDKQNTYTYMLGKYKKSIRSECYFEALIIVYAMIEDRMKSILYHSGCIASRATNKFNKKCGVDNIVREIIKDYITEKENVALGLSTITNKMKIVRCLTCWASETDKKYNDEYILLLKKQYESIDAYEMSERMLELRDWLDYRNEIIHGLLNKNMDSLYEELAIKVEEGMQLARYFDAQCKVIKKGDKVRKYLHLQNN